MIRTVETIKQKVFEWENRPIEDGEQDESHSFKALWKGVFTMYNIVSDGVNSVSDGKEYFEKWEIKAEELTENFLSLHDGYRLRIYFHILMAHGKDLYKIYGPLRWLSNQGAEAANGKYVYIFPSFPKKWRKNSPFWR